MKNSNEKIVNDFLQYIEREVKIRRRDDLKYKDILMEVLGTIKSLYGYARIEAQNHKDDEYITNTLISETTAITLINLINELNSYTLPSEIVIKHEDM